MNVISCNAVSEICFRLVQNIYIKESVALKIEQEK